jgi:hypothetical protein
MKDLVITAASNYDWPPLNSFAMSLSRSGFEGTKLLLSQSLTQYTLNRLQELGFTLGNHKVVSGNFFVDRYASAIEYLNDHSGEFRYVLWVDCRDLVFQSNPSVWLEQHLSPSKVLGCSMGLLIKDDATESTWVNTLVGAETHAWLKDEEALCSGTIAGEASAVLEVLSEVYRLGVDSNKKNPEWTLGVDEAALNYVLRTEPFKSIMRVPRMSEGFTASCTSYLRECFANSPWQDNKPWIDAAGLVYPEGKTIPFSILHQYDRDQSWYARVYSRYLGMSA